MENTTSLSQNPNPIKTIPKDAEGLCWGGFFLTLFWSIGNKTWIGLLILIPFVGLIMPFVLLFKGREWAWKNDTWKDVEHFNRVQKIWTVVGICLWLIFPVVGILAAIAIPNFQKFQSKALQSEAKMALQSIYMSEIALQSNTGSYSSDLSKLSITNLKNYRIGFTATGAEFAEYCKDCTASKDHFKAVAISVPNRKMKNTDVWTIDENRNLVHITNE
jgi:type II secretory pathway pseudopilin PulG